jgi:hypothetical protein
MRRTEDPIDPLFANPANTFGRGGAAPALARDPRGNADPVIYGAKLVLAPLVERLDPSRMYAFFEEARGYAKLVERSGEQQKRIVDVENVFGCLLDLRSGSTSTLCMM